MPSQLPGEKGDAYQKRVSFQRGNVDRTGRRTLAIVKGGESVLQGGGQTLRNDAKRVVKGLRRRAAVKKVATDPGNLTVFTWGGRI